MNLNSATATTSTDGPSALLPAKKPKAHPTDFADARRACRTPAEREQLALVLKARWTSAELCEYARLFHFRNGKDYPTAMSYRRAIADLAVHYRGLGYPDAKPSDYPHQWLIQFRKGGSKLLPPRREGLLQRGRGLSQYRVSDEEYSWPGHTEEFRSMIEQRARDYFKITPEQPVHVNAWAASQRAYWREQYRVNKEAEKIAKAAKKAQAPLRSPKKPNPRKLAPQFNRDWEGHTDEFREEVADWARYDRGLAPGAYVGPRWWKIACNKHYELTED
jgi:hypothetical protein